MQFIYGQVSKVLHKYRFCVTCFDGNDLICFTNFHKVYKRSPSITNGDIVLICKGVKNSIVRKLTNREAELLETFKYIPTNCNMFESINFNENSTVL